MEHQAGLPFLRETLLFLTLAGILIPLLQRFKINQVLGFFDDRCDIRPLWFTTIL